jgi:hypothetical protein
MPRYENSIIYKLCHQDDLENNNIYVGSTTNFRNRKYQHKNNCNNENREKYNFQLYQYIRDNGNWNEWEMIPIEVYPCNDKKELEVRERYHIELLKSKLNQVIPTRTGKEWYEDNKKIIAEKAKKYYEANKETLLEYKKEYRNNNKEVLNEKQKDYYEANKEIIKKYQESNKEKLKEYYKKRYEANKEKILEKAKEKVICDNCGYESTKINLKRHQQSNKCKNYNITKE